MQVAPLPPGGVACFSLSAVAAAPDANLGSSINTAAALSAAAQQAAAELAFYERRATILLGLLLKREGVRACAWSGVSALSVVTHCC